VTLAGGVARVTSANAVLEVQADGLEFAVEAGWYSPGYGRRQEVPFLRARRLSRSGEDTTVLRLAVSPR
jgi:hypothetical protein